MVMAMQGLWTPWTRLLKALPFSVRQINALLLFTPFATWTILWLLGWFGYALAYGTPQTLRVGFVFGMAGLPRSCTLPCSAFRAAQALAGSLRHGGLMPQLAKIGLSDSPVTQIVFAVIGAIALCLAAFINHRTLTRSTSSSRAYRRPQPAFGMPAKPRLA